MRNGFGVWFAAFEETDPDFGQTEIRELLILGIRQSAKSLVTQSNGSVIPATHLRLAR
jgi:hypothetical protein